MGTMPVMQVDSLLKGFDDKDARIIKAGFTGRGRFSKEGGNMRLRSSKPFKQAKTIEEGCANYVWRMICFDIVGWGKHVCMPVCADFDLEDQVLESEGGSVRYGRPGYEEQKSRVRKVRDDMDDLVKLFERFIPIEKQAGVLRWGPILGLV